MLVFVSLFLCDTFCFVFFFNDTATTEIYTLSLHDALPIYSSCPARALKCPRWRPIGAMRSEEHTSELQSRVDISYAVFCLKKNKNKSVVDDTHRTLITGRHEPHYRIV